MIRVGLDTQVLQGAEASGFGYYVAGLVKALEQSPVKGLEICKLKSKWEKDLNSFERFYHDRFELPKLAEQAKIDILHQPVFSCPKSNKPVIWTIHDLRSIIRNEAMSLAASLYWKKWLPYSVRYATHIVCTSENTQRDVTNLLGVPKEAIRIIPVGLPDEVVHWRMAAKDQAAVLQKYKVTQPFFSSVGTIQPIKNYPFLIDVFAALRKEYNLKHQLVIIGKKGWDYENVSQRLMQHNLHEGIDVIITGYVTDDEKWALVQSSEAFCFPSLYEGFGIPPLEAQALGTPVLASNNSSIPGVIGEGGLLCSDSDVASWVAAYGGLVKEREALIRHGKTNSKRFFWSEIAQQWLAFYREVGSII